MVLPVHAYLAVSNVSSNKAIKWKTKTKQNTTKCKLNIAVHQTEKSKCLEPEH